MRPIELYRFNQGGVITTLTSSDKEVTYLAEVYEPTSMARSNLDQKAELSKSALEVRLPIGLAVARDWMNATSEATVGLTVFQQSDLGTNVIWKGRLAGVKPGVADITLNFESVFTSLRRPGLRARFTRTCRHNLYGPRCGLDKDDFAEVREATAMSGLVVTIPTAAGDPAGDYFTGMLEYNGTFRFITVHSGASLTLSRALPDLSTALLSAPVNVTLYPGCDRSHTRCIARFSNLVRQGAFRFIPIRNPFDGSSIV